MILIQKGQFIFQKRLKGNEPPMVSLHSVCDILQGWHDGVLYHITQDAIDSMLALPRFTKGKRVKNSHKKDPKMREQLHKAVDEYREVVEVLNMAKAKYKSEKCTK